MTRDEYIEQVARWMGKPHPPVIAFMVAAEALVEGRPVPLWALESLNHLPEPRLTGLRRTEGGFEGTVEGG